MFARAILSVFVLLQLIAPLAHAHPGEPGEAHFHVDLPLQQAATPTIAPDDHVLKAIGIAEGIAPPLVLIVVALVCAVWFVRARVRGRKRFPLFHSRVPQAPDSPPPPSRAPPR